MDFKELPQSAKLSLGKIFVVEASSWEVIIHHLRFSELYVFVLFRAYIFLQRLNEVIVFFLLNRQEKIPISGKNGKFKDF